VYRNTFVLTAGAILATGLTACADQDPTAPKPEAASAAAAVAAPNSATAERAQLGAALADAETRLVAGLSDPSRATALGGALATLRRSLSSGTQGRFDGSTGDARTALGAYESDAARINDGDAGPDAADLAAIRLVLDRLDAVTTSSTAAQ
jgi:hypothetical protein